MFARGVGRWALAALIADHASMATTARRFGVCWHTANTPRRAAEEELLEHDPTRWEAVRVVGVDEHVRRCAGGYRFVSVIVDSAPVRERRGPSRARGIVPGRCEQALTTWLAGRPGSHEGGRPEWWRWTGSAGRPGVRPPKNYRASPLVIDPSTPAPQRVQALEECRQRARRQIRGRKGQGRGLPCTRRAAPF